MSIFSYLPLLNMILFDWNIYIYIYTHTHTHTHTHIWSHALYSYIVEKGEYLFRVCQLFTAAHRLSLLAENGGYSPVAVCSFSLQWLLLWSTHSRVHRLQQLLHRLSSHGWWAPKYRLNCCGAQVWLPCAMWDLSD